MTLKTGDLVLVLPPEECGLNRRNRGQYGAFWNDRPIDPFDLWRNNTVNMDFYLGKIAVVDSIWTVEPLTVHLKLHKIYGQKGGGWTFNARHLKKIEDEDEPTEG